MSISKICVVMFSLLSICLGQKINDAEVNIKYTRLPMKPLDESITNYSASVELAYLNKISELKQKTEEEFRRLEAEYPELVKKAEEKYVQDSIEYIKHKTEAEEKFKQEKQEYKKKSVLSKFIENKVLEQDNAPKMEFEYSEPYKQIPPKPELVYPDELKYQKVFDTSLLVSSYLILDGYERKDENALKIAVTLHGFEYKEPELKTVTKSETAGNGNSIDVPLYHWELMYKHPMTVKLINPDGSLKEQVLIPELNNFALYKTPESKNKHDLNFKKEDVLNVLVDKVVEDNMNLIKNHINGQYGKSLIERKTVLFNVLPKKKQNYDDFKSAFQNAFDAYSQMEFNKNEALAKLSAAAQIWEKALTESNPEDRKSRVNKDVTMVAHYNCAEAYLWLNQFDKAYEHINKCTLFKPNNDEQKMINDCKVLIDDQNKRLQANK